MTVDSGLVLLKARKIERERNTDINFMTVLIGRITRHRMKHNLSLYLKGYYNTLNLLELKVLLGQVRALTTLTGIYCIEPIARTVDLTNEMAKYRSIILYLLGRIIILSEENKPN